VERERERERVNEERSTTGIRLFVSKRDIIWKKANILFLAISNNFGAAPPNMSTELGFRIVHK